MCQKKVKLIIGLKALGTSVGLLFSIQCDLGKIWKYCHRIILSASAYTQMCK